MLKVDQHCDLWLNAPLGFVLVFELQKIVSRSAPRCVLSSEVDIEAGKSVPVSRFVSFERVLAIHEEGRHTNMAFVMNFMGWMDLA